MDAGAVYPASTCLKILLLTLSLCNFVASMKLDPQVADDMQFD